MTEPSCNRKKQKITCKASPEGVKKAESTLIRLGFETKVNFAESQRLSRSTVTKFFYCRQIQLDSFKKICKALTLNWQDIIDIPAGDEDIEWIKKEKVNSSPVVKEDVESGQALLQTVTDVCKSQKILEEIILEDFDPQREPVQTIVRKLIAINKKNQEIKAEIILEGDFDSVHKDLSVWRKNFLEEHPDTSIKIIAMQPGSIKLIIEGLPEDIEMLLANFESGELRQIGGFPVKDIQILNEATEDDKSSKQKWRLVEEICNNSVEGRDLSDVDLSDADLRNSQLISANLRNADLSNCDLSGTNLSGANLSGADLSGANLSGTNLSGANLSSTDQKLDKLDLTDLNLAAQALNNLIDEADLSSANLIHTNLRDANLRGANLSGANLSGADLSSANLSHANLSSANLIRTNLSSANLSNANLRNTYLGDAYLKDINLSHTNLSHTNLSHTNMNDAYLVGTDLSSTDLSSTDLSGARLSHANLSGAYLIGANLIRANLVRANMIRANLIRANLRSANLRGADLRGAYLRDADLRGAELNVAKIQGARFGENLGISEEMKRDLIKRGAIFEDSPGDRLPIPAPH